MHCQTTIKFYIFSVHSGNFEMSLSHELTENVKKKKSKICVCYTLFLTKQSEYNLFDSKK